MRNERIGVYLCHCGSNIASAMSLPEIADFARSLSGVALVADSPFLCAGDGQENIVHDIRRHGLTGVVVAACSPHVHEQTFRRALDLAGLNPYLLEICNVREQNAWVTANRDEATERAMALVAAAVARVAKLVSLRPRTVAVEPATLVIGGGIAGIQASLLLAEAGYPVYLVERQASIGGHMAQLDRTFPSLDCAACALSPKMHDVDNHQKITLLSLAEVESVEGSVGNFQVRVRVRPRFIDPVRCINCGVCSQYCPVEVIDEGHDEGLARRAAVFSPSFQSVPRLPMIDQQSCLYFADESCRRCEEVCPAKAVDFGQQETVLSLTVGAIILATGFSLFDPRAIPQYGYGRFENVFTSLEFERLLAAEGPTRGRILLRDGFTRPERVAIIHCVGSRDKNYHQHCSRVCCMYALKFAHQVRNRTQAEVFCFYIDMRTPGKKGEEFYHRLLDEGVHFVRGRPAMVMDAAFTPEEKGRLVVQAEDTMLGRMRRVAVDMVILCPAMLPREDARDLASVCGMGCDATGFFTERHEKLAPVETVTDGIYLAGCCQGPKDIADTIAQAGAAVARVLTSIAKGRQELLAHFAEIDGSRCSGCRICLSLCPYRAINWERSENRATISEERCKGCGVCVAACPAGAITGRHYTGEQFIAQIDGILHDRRDQSGPGAEKAANPMEES